MRRLAGLLVRLYHRLRALVALLLAPFIWAWQQVKRLVKGFLGPPWEAFLRLVGRIKTWIERIITWLLAKWASIFAIGRTPRVREPRVGAAGAPLLAAISLAFLWYFLPVARWAGWGPFRFVLFGFALWVVLLITWLSRCRADRRGKVATFAQGVHRSTGQRGVDVTGLLLSVALAYLVQRQIQLLPLAFASVLAFLALLTVKNVPRPGLVRLHAPPPFAAADAPTRVDGPSRTRTLIWTVTANGETHRHSATVEIPEAAAEAAKAVNPGSADSAAAMVEWVEYGGGADTELLARQIAEQSFGGGYSVLATVSCYLAAVQSLAYSTDLETAGRAEYWRYPVETLYDGTGDCEDSAILLAALVRRAGHRCALFVFDDHVGVGVEIPPDTPGSSVEIEGVRYYYCETTSDGFRIGDLPAGADRKDVEVVPIPPWSKRDA